MIYSTTITLVIALMLNFTASESQNKLITYDEAKALATKLSSFEADVLAKLAVDPREDLLRSLSKNFVNNATIITKIWKIVSSIETVKNIFKKQIENPETNVYKLGVTLRKVDVEVGKIRAELYGDEPEVFDTLARNKDTATNCVTKGSSVKLINQLFNSLVYTEIEVAAFEKHLLELQIKLGRPDNITEDQLWAHFSYGMNELRQVASDALNIAEREIAKCKARVTG